MRNRPHGARKADFAEIDAIRGKGKTGERGHESRRDRIPEVDSAIASLEAPNDNARVGAWINRFLESPTP